MADIIVPEFGESIIEGTIHHWLKKVGEPIEKGEVVVEIETEKVNAEVPAEQSGILKTILKHDGDVVKVGEVIAHVDINQRDQSETANSNSNTVAEASGKSASNEDEKVLPKQDKPESDQARSTSENFNASSVRSNVSPQQVSGKKNQSDRTQILATPAARKMARERGIDLHQLSGPDPLGRIHKQDLSNDSSDGQADSDKPYERIKMSRRRQTIAKHLVQAQQSAAMLTTFNEVDMTAIMEVRKRRKDAFLKQHQVKLGFMSFFTKAAVSALKQFPNINAEIDGDEIIMKRYYDIGIAVSTEEGLVVPVVKEADRMSFAEIEQDIERLADKARNKKLKLDDLRGGTFTITNGGIFGSLLSTPILNTPQVGILGMHKIQTRPVAIDEERMENRPMMYIALSYDHRIVDGKEAVSFLVKIKELLEDPETLLLEG